MDISGGVCSPRIRSDSLRKEGSEEIPLQGLEMELSSDVGHDYQIQSMNALDIMRETVRILRFNSWGFMGIMTLLICPVSAVILSKILVNESIVQRLALKLMLVAQTSGFSLTTFIKDSSHRFAETMVSSVICFPLYITLLLSSKAAVFYTVECTYLRKLFDASKFCTVIAKLWRPMVSTYAWTCTAIVGCIILFAVFLVAFCSAFSVLGFPSEMVVWAVMVVGLVFSVIFANVIIICKVALVISMLEDVSGAQAMLRSKVLISGRTQVGLVIFLVSAIGMAFVEGLFEHRVKTVSYGDGSSRMWEGPLLVIMYSFVLLVESMMNAVFYFSCKFSYKETSDVEGDSVSDTRKVVSAESVGIQ
ncbi:uncharacterized protein LOC129284581 [Prosopis cineraria]|uniref:uncharacterized protein LOC129284581 n=1 Tax=Prosopis cineraria TaxID=364024 RepID=UPI0024104DC0|nr:uncharacterized protein LOC129284581 [Prosopis cineraria]XP_054776072.1 uncharacterized protein LOC129284581 [Prosopis cineraria]